MGSHGRSTPTPRANLIHGLMSGASQTDTPDTGAGAEGAGATLGGFAGHARGHTLGYIGGEDRLALH